MKIQKLAPVLKEIRECYNHFQNEHAQMVQEHRDMQRDLRLLVKDIKILSPHKAKKKSLNNKPKVSKKDISDYFKSMSTAQREELKEQLLL